MAIDDDSASGQFFIDAHHYKIQQFDDHVTIWRIEPVGECSVSVNANTLHDADTGTWDAVATPRLILQCEHEGLFDKLYRSGKTGMTGAP